jgi:uncharacterized caspase-like protein
MIRARGLAWLIAGWLAATPALAQPAEARRVALVIGNGAYDHWDPLKNAVSDAHLITARLLAIGFRPEDVIEGDNLRVADMPGLLRKFRTRAMGADLVVVYYTGHGGVISDQNWLIAKDADESAMVDDTSANLNATSLDDLIKLARLGRVGLVLIDACRENLGHAAPAGGDGARKGGR